jgi:17beta-estradiol 17-dehydrogenase / very-long-chain 3-oxoacyl-CoA reductase
MVQLGPAFSPDRLPITILSTIGIFTVLYAVQCLYSFLTLHLLTSKYPLKNYKRESSEPTYALITGASAGIGLGIGKALVKKGFGIILLGHLLDE